MTPREAWELLGQTGLEFIRLGDQLRESRRQLHSDEVDQAAFDAARDRVRQRSDQLVHDVTSQLQTAGYTQLAAACLVMTAKICVFNGQPEAALAQLEQATQLARDPLREFLKRVFSRLPPDPSNTELLVLIEAASRAFDETLLQQFLSLSDDQVAAIPPLYPPEEDL